MPAVTDAPRRLSVDQVAQYKEQGFMVLPGALDTRAVEVLREDTARLCRWVYGPIAGDTAPEPDETDDDLLQRHLCIHFPHKISPVMRQTLAAPPIVAALTSIIGPNVKCMQSMLFVKATGMPGQAWHQDEIYIPTRDRSLTGAWIALDDATVENGCLWAIPGSHRPGVLWPQEQRQDPRFDCSAETHGYPFPDEEAVPLEAKAGDIVLFNGYLLHRSLPNTAPSGYRRALVNHYMSAESLLPWFHQGDAPMAQQDVRDIVMVAGVDPHAYKGTEDIHGAHLRPSGKGGCQGWGGED